MKKINLGNQVIIMAIFKYWRLWLKGLAHILKIIITKYNIIIKLKITFIISLHLKKFNFLF